MTMLTDTFRGTDSFSPTVRPLVMMMREGRTERYSNDSDQNTIRRKVEAGLDRLLRDIEKLEEAERWDGMS
jgi:hypothetical protein